MGRGRTRGICSHGHQPMNLSAYLLHEKRRRIGVLVGLVCLVLLTTALVAWSKWAHGIPSTQAETGNQTVSSQPVQVPLSVDRVVDTGQITERHLDGMMVATADSNEWPVCVMVDNAAFDGVRPQSGLSRALVVYEVIVEGGITRFLAVYGGEFVAKIGPVRSARDTYIEFVSELDCLYGYAGGSFTALQTTQKLNLRTLNALSADGAYYWRDHNLFAPHNLFTSSDQLILALKDKQVDSQIPTFSSWSFRDQPEALTAESERASEVEINFSTPSYQVRWVYDPDQGVYQRYNGGQLQIDTETQETLTAHNVVVQFVPPGQYIEGKGRINFAVTGEGQVLIFRYGEVVKGTWKKDNRIARTEFFDAQGQTVELNRGNIWVEIVPTDRSVTYSI